MDEVTVVLADDHEIWRHGVRAELGPPFRVVGEAAEAAEAVRVVRDRRPGLVLCDLNMPGGGIEVVRACAAETRIVMLTVSAAERDVLDAVIAGAVGYLVKSTPAAELRVALLAAAAGEPVFSPELAALVLGEFRKLAKASGPVSPLSPREREVLQLVARGHTHREIAAKLYISHKTVENHVRNILGKLHLNGKSALIRYAVDHGVD